MVKPSDVPPLTVLKRRRDYLAGLIRRGEYISAWDTAEKNALDWAIERLETG